MHTFKTSTARRAFLVAALLSGLFLPTAFPQTSTSTVSGNVRDQSDAVVPQAAVTLINTATNVKFQTRTNEVGFYVFPGIIPGPYRLEASSPGMANYEVTLVVQVAQKITVDPTLKPATTTTSVVVADATPVINVTDSTMSHVINRTQIDQLPQSDRSFRSQLVTVPGVERQGYMAWGQRYGSTDFQLDGTPLVSRSRGAVQYGEPGLDSIEEISVDSNNVSAKYNSPVVVIVSTKSGTNSLHGALFETHVNSRVGGARRRESGNDLAPYRNRPQYGGSAGGPVLLPKIYDGRNRTFWFYAYERLSDVNNSLANYSVPTAAMRNGDFSGLVDSAGRFTAIFDPWTTDPTTFQRQPFWYGGKLNAIDPSRVSPLWKSLMNLTPMPTSPDVNPLITSNWFGNARSLQTTYTMAVRVDHRFSDRDMVYARYSKNGTIDDRPFTGAIPLLTNGANRNGYTAPSQSLALSWVRTVSPTLFNEVLATVYRQAFYQAADPNSLVDWPAQLGLPNPLGRKQWPDITGLGLNGTLYRTIYPNADKSTFYQIDDNLTKVVGRHQLSMGVHLRRDLINYLAQQVNVAGAAQPSATWTALWDSSGTTDSPRATALTGSPIASAYLGQMGYQVLTVPGYFYMRENQYAAYFQDNFKVTRRLTLNLGLRWQASPAIHEKYGNITGFDVAQKAVVLTQSLDRYYQLNTLMAPAVARLQSLGVKFIDHKQAGLPRNLIFSNWKNFGPRLGFAYRTSSGDKALVVRGGYSRAYTTTPMKTLVDNLSVGIPFRSNPVYFPDSQGYYPDGKPGWSLRSVPTYVAGQNTRNILDNPGGALGLTAGSLTSAFIDPHYPDARVDDWNLTLEKEILPKTLARAGWVGNHAAYLDAVRNINPQPSSFIWASNVGTPYPTSAGGSRPYDAIYGNIMESGKYGYSNFTGLQFELARRYSEGFGYQVFYVISNSASLGLIDDQGTQVSTLPATSFLNSQVAGLSQEQIERLVYYTPAAYNNRIPRQRLSWNWVADLPVGKGKLLGRNMRGVLDLIAGGWQISGLGSWRTNWFALPGNQFPTGNPFEIYGRKYPIQDCRSGHCLSGFLYHNGYINPAQINSVDARGDPNGIMGVPGNYKPAFQNLIPFPASPIPGDPNAPFYGTNTVFVPQKDGTVWRGNWGGIAPLQNQYVEGPGLWSLSASLFKSFPIRERMRLRVQWDVFNPTNSPQQPASVNSQGIRYTYLSGTSARSMQFTLRLLW
ncbi:MAG: carboxypeptidase-like regulatory domain-containing protein [Acidobacteriota bacterium]